MTGPDMTVSDALSNAAAAATNITSNATAVINKSSVPVNVAVEAMVHNGDITTPIDAANPSAAAVNLVDDVSDVMSASDASHAGVYLAITPISGASITSVTTGAATQVADLTLDAANVANKTVTGAVFTLSDVAFNLTNSTLLTTEAYAVTSNADSANPTKFNVDLKGMPEAYKITSTSSVAVLDEPTANGILGRANSGVSFMFNICGKVDYTSPIWQEFDPDQNVNGQQKIELQVKFIITKVSDKPSYVSKTTISATDNTFDVVYPDGATAISSIVITKVDGSRVTWTRGNQYTVNGNTVSINVATISSNVGASITVTFNDSAQTTAIVNLN